MYFVQMCGVRVDLSRDKEPKGLNVWVFNCLLN